MNNFARLCTVMALLLVAACGQDGGGSGEKTRAWKFAIEEIEGSVQHRYALAFKERIEARSDGRISVTIYPYGQLGTSSQLTELVQLGSIQFAMASPGHLGAVIPEVQLFSLHFVFSDDESINHRVLMENVSLRKTLQEAYGEAGLHFLGAFQEGWMAWTANKPITQPADFQGVKIRTMNSPLLIRAYELYGASPVTMPYSEVYSGLQLNMIDAQVNPVFAIEEMSFYEVQSHLMLPRHLPFTASVVANPQFFKSLTDKERELVMDVNKEVQEYILGVQQELNDARMNIIDTESDIEIVSLSESQRAAFREASLPIREEYVQRAGPRGARLLEILSKAIESETSGAGRVRSAGN